MSASNTAPGTPHSAPAMHPDLAEILIDEPALQARITALAADIRAGYDPDAVPILVAVLKGAFIFLADLTRQLGFLHEVDFMAVSSYGEGTTSSGVVRIIMDLERNITGRDVLIVEDIIDTGNTLSYLRRILGDRGPRSLRICTLLNKPSRRTVNVPVDYIGFDIPDRFVVGYGLDFAEKYRDLRYIGVLKPEMYG
jgi:hypoxanthine phosphoribosyltransferase